MAEKAWDGQNSSDIIWLGQAPETPFQEDQKLGAGTSLYDGNSACGNWPTFEYTKAHRLHDIKTLCDVCNTIDITKLTDGGPPLTLRQNFEEIAAMAENCRFCSLLAQSTRGAKGFRYGTAFCHFLVQQDCWFGNPVTLELRSGVLTACIPRDDDPWLLGKFSVLTAPDPLMEDLTTKSGHMADPPNVLQLLERLKIEISRVLRCTGCEVCLSEVINSSLEMRNNATKSEDARSSSSVPRPLASLRIDLRRTLSRAANRFRLPRLMETPSVSTTTSSPLRTPLLACNSMTILPDRVIEILDISTNDPIMVRLLPTDGKMSGNYATLSHRWGGEFNMKTTKLSLGDRLKGFRLEDLPRTFHDAALVALAMDIKYLWIDSLCIVQDDRTEWLEQSAKMGSIYMNAAFTIAVHSAGQCNEGFLWRSQISPTIRIAPSRGGPEFLLELPDVKPEELEFRFKDSKISRRAWILQELTLSPRILHFVENRLLWECKHECGPARAFRHETTATIFRNTQGLAEMKTMWLTLVTRYTYYQMTQSGDKLVAIAGLAQVALERLRDMADTGGLQYHCGVIQEDLERSLLWYRSSLEAKRHSARAPSWSWASLDGKLRFVNLDRETKRRTLMRVRNLQHEDSLIQQGGQPKCRIVMEASMVQITGHLMFRKWKHIWYHVAPPYAGSISVMVRNWGDDAFYAWCVMDELDLVPDATMRESEQMTLTFIVITGAEANGKVAGAWCIVVAPETGVHGTYRRLGLGYIRDMTILAPALATTETVTLI